jgi:hypothetical protein|tara:strand:+ start:295 stop:594 length:300 start_codon:yes stop_codon:yes gene_type:complete|eukprot:23783-Pelagococcus_subviridis.AAC.1
MPLSERPRARDLAADAAASRRRILRVAVRVFADLTRGRELERDARVASCACGGLAARSSGIGTSTVTAGFFQVLIFTHHSVSTFDRVPFQLTYEHHQTD